MYNCALLLLSQSGPQFTPKCPLWEFAVGVASVDVAENTVSRVQGIFVANERIPIHFSSILLRRSEPSLGTPQLLSLQACLGLLWDAKTGGLVKGGMRGQRNARQPSLHPPGFLILLNVLQSSIDLVHAGTFGEVPESSPIPLRCIWLRASLIF